MFPSTARLLFKNNDSENARYSSSPDSSMLGSPVSVSVKELQGVPERDDGVQERDDGEARRLT